MKEHKFPWHTWCGKPKQDSQRKKFEFQMRLFLGVACLSVNDGIIDCAVDEKTRILSKLHLKLDLQLGGIKIDR